MKIKNFQPPRGMWVNFPTDGGGIFKDFLNSRGVPYPTYTTPRLGETLDWDAAALFLCEYLFSMKFILPSVNS